MSVDVTTVVSMPDVDDTSFFLSDTTQMRTRMSGQCCSLHTCDAQLSLPSAAVPMFQRTNPPNSDRHADPDPSRATPLTSPSTLSTLDKQKTKHAYPDALQTNKIQIDP